MDLEAVFGPGGFLSQQAGWEERPQQLALARAIAENRGHLMAEAPTGIGKTMAYLVPLAERAIRSGKPGIVATSTVLLQEQVAQEALRLRHLFPGLKVSVLKGKGHYLCPTALEAKAREDKRFRALEIHARHGNHERSQMPPELAPLFDQVSAAKCLVNQHCRDCHLKEARDRAGRSHLVVTSHALLLMQLRTGSKLLPDFQEIVIDEAHGFADRVTEHLSFALDPERLPGLEIGQATGTDTSAHRALQGCLAQVLAMNPLPGGSDAVLLGAGRGWQDVCRKAAPIIRRLRQIVEDLGRRAQRVKDKEDLALLVEALYEYDALLNRAERFFKVDNEVRWRQRNRLQYAPLEVGGFLSSRLWSRCRSHLVSATLQGIGGFDRRTLGLPAGPELVLDSPFDYEEQCLLAVADATDPGHDSHPRAVAEVLAELHSLGLNTLGLFTSYASLSAAAMELRRLGTPVLVQGEGVDRVYLVERFRAGGGVLIGTSSFWEGLDLVGDRLQALVIAKLPFDVPTDPIHQARARLYTNPFMEYTVGRAAYRLRQGFGRLIRTRRDRGVCVIMDSRLTSKAYGHLLLGALPKCSRYEGPDLRGAVRAWFSGKELARRAS